MNGPDFLKINIQTKINTNYDLFEIFLLFLAKCKSEFPGKKYNIIQRLNVRHLTKINKHIMTNN